MIPVRLSLKNFMCYRDNVPPLSFDGIHVACLCGDNGNGKSAIFDAMTWALWGKSRAKSDDDLVHLGQSEMEVEIEFVSGGQRYRVIRKHIKKLSQSRAGHTMLELQIANDRGFSSISGNSLQETQQKIIQLLKLDYETFKNSAFLRQGHADEFSVKRPAERKEVLANILGLSYYDELERRAKDLANKKIAEAEELASSINDIERQLIPKSEYEAEAKKIQHRVSDLEKEKKASEAFISMLREQKGALEIKREQLLNIQVRLDEARKELGRWRVRAKQHKDKIIEYERVLAQRSMIEEGFYEFMQTKKLDDERNQQLIRLLALREDMSNLDKAISQAAEELIVEHRVIQARIAEKEVKFARVSQLKESLEQARHHLAELDKIRETVVEGRKQSQQVMSQISYLESMSNLLEAEVTDLKEKCRLLAQQDDARCPLCETELGVNGRQQIEAKLAFEAEEKAKALKTTSEELTKQRARLLTLEDEIAERERLFSREQGVWQGRLFDIEKDLADATQVGIELAQEKLRLAELEQCLSGKRYAVQEQQRRMQLETEEKQLGYSKERHEQLKQRLAELRKYETLKQQLDEATSAIDEEKAALTEAAQTVLDLEEKIEADLKKSDALSNEVAALPDIDDKLRMAERAQRDLLGDEQQLRDELATIKERLRHLKELELTKKEKQKLLHHSLEEEGIYKELAEAFGKKGIQALLIEQAIPEIENEASRLLGRMTDNRMSIALETQRESKKGDTIETLDIKIADELGTRNYEMYSGGEAFRIDLALRIALSRLLVRRAGASLPILIIDEGFGTQDSSGREKLVEAISSIQDDFEKIFVITHLEELRDRFPALIYVTKTANGSFISIS